MQTPKTADIDTTVDNYLARAEGAAQTLVSDLGELVATLTRYRECPHLREMQNNAAALIQSINNRMDWLSDGIAKARADAEAREATEQKQQELAEGARNLAALHAADASQPAAS